MMCASRARAFVADLGRATLAVLNLEGRRIVSERLANRACACARMYASVCPLTVKLRCTHDDGEEVVRS
jgi:hypothetical protein